MLHFASFLNLKMSSLLYSRIDAVLSLTWRSREEEPMTEIVNSNVSTKLMRLSMIY